MAFIKNPLILLIIFLILSVVSLIVGLLFGSVNIPLYKVVHILLFPTNDVATQIIWELRLPRISASFVCGGLLALAGALLQVLLRNPLADPYILGVSGGAAVGALTATLLGWGMLFTNLISLIGALLAIAIVFRIPLELRIRYFIE